MKTIITALGKNKPGILAGISTRLYEMNINILDVSQTIMDGYFTMTMMADMAESSKPFDEAKKELLARGEELNVIIRMQRMDIFDAMHQV